MGSEMESDMLSPAADRGLALIKQLEARKEAEAEDAEEDDEDLQDGCDDGCCDEDPLAEAKEDSAGVEEADEELGDDDEAEEEGQEPGDGDGDTEAAPARKKKRKKRAKSVGTAKPKKESSATTKRSKSIGATSRLEELSKPKPAVEAPAVEETAPPKPEKKTKGCRPSLLLKIKPLNLQEAMEAFFENGFTEAPKFIYAYSDEVVSKAFQDNSTVCFDYLPEAKRIMDKVLESPGGPDAFFQLMYGEEKVSSDVLHDLIADYLKDHNVEDQVEIRIVEGMLSAANVVTGDGKHIVNIAKGPVSKSIIESICDHEVGTHLLRMMNDEHQVWHGIRSRYRLANPWTTEEGFATLNTYQTLPSKLMFPQALRYWAVCRGAQTGFVELFKELQAYVSDTKRCWQICCRIKRGMLDTSQPGAFYMDQAYFKGAVEILKHLDEVDFGRLYGGQIALQDMDKVHFLLRKEVVRLPRFLNSAEKLQTYLAHCRSLMKENMIETAPDRVCKRIYVRAGQSEFFKKEEKKSALKSATLGAPGRPLDPARLEDLAKPRNFSSATDDEGGDEGSGTQEMSMSRASNFARLAELAVPRKGSEDFARTPTSATDDEGAETGLRRPSNFARLAELAMPRRDKPIGNEDDRIPSRTLDPARLAELARPKQAGDRLADEVPPPPEPFRPPDLARLASLAAPKKFACEAETQKVPCNCKPKKGKRKRRSKLRLLAMVQAKKESQEEQKEDDQASDGEAESQASEELQEELQTASELRQQEEEEELRHEEEEPLEAWLEQEAEGLHSEELLGLGEDQELQGSPDGEALRVEEQSDCLVLGGVQKEPCAEAGEEEQLEKQDIEAERARDKDEKTSSQAEPEKDWDQLEKELDKHKKLDKLGLWQPRPGYGNGYGPMPNATAGLQLAPRPSLVEVAVQGSAARREKPRPYAGLVRAATRVAAHAAKANHGPAFHLQEASFKAVPIKTMQLDLGI